MRNPTLMLTHPEVSKEHLLAMVRLIPEVRIGINIAAPLLILEGQRPGRIANVLGLTRQSLNLWKHRVNERRLRALEPIKKPGRRVWITPRVQQQLEEELEKCRSEFGLRRVRWDGPTLVVHLKRRFGITLKVRQAQSWVYQLGYRLKWAEHTSLQDKNEKTKGFPWALKETPGADSEGNDSL